MKNSYENFDEIKSMPGNKEGADRIRFRLGLLSFSHTTFEIFKRNPRIKQPVSASTVMFAKYGTAQVVMIKVLILVNE